MRNQAALAQKQSFHCQAGKKTIQINNMRIDFADVPADGPHGKFRRIKNFRLSGWHPLIELNAGIGLISPMVAVPCEHVKLKLATQQIDQIGKRRYRSASLVAGQIPVSEN